MKIFQALLGLVLMSQFALASINQIPASAFAVIKIDPNGMDQNGFATYLEQLPMINKGVKSLPESVQSAIQSMINNPSELGFNNQSSIIAYSDMTDEGLVVHIQFDLADESKFEKWASTVFQETIHKSFEQKDDYKVMLLGETHFYYHPKGAGMIFADAQVNIEYSEEEDYVAYAQREQEMKTEKSQMMVMKTIRDFYGEGKKITSNSNFKKAMKADGDILGWVNTGNILQQLIAENQKDMMRYSSVSNPFNQLSGAMNSWTEDSYYHFALKSEMSQMNFDLTYFQNDKMSKILRKTYGNNMSKNFQELIPENTMLEGSLLFDVSESINAFWKLYELPKEIASPVAESVNVVRTILSNVIDEDGVEKMISGQLYASLLGMNEVEKSYQTYDYNEETGEYEENEYTYYESVPQVVVLVGIGDPHLTESILKVLTAFKGEQSENYYQIEEMMLKVQDDVLIVSNNAEYMNHERITHGTISPGVKEMKKHYLFASFDGMKLVDQSKNDSTLSAKDSAYMAVVGKYSPHIKMTARQKGKKQFKVHMEATTSNDQYFLISLADFIQEMNEVDEKFRRSYYDEYEMTEEMYEDDMIYGDEMEEPSIEIIEIEEETEDE